jgi:transposase-like protein
MDGRIEVITSVEGGRRWSKAEIQQLASASREAGASVSAMARAAGIQPGQLYGWGRQSGVRPWIGFAPVRIAPEAALASAVDRGTIEISADLDRDRPTDMRRGMSTLVLQVQ